MPAGGAPCELPRFVVAAPASGHGKTTVAIGLMAALRRRGLAVAPAKVGPDYIDPGYHLLASGRPGRNLDPFLVGEERIAPLLLHGASTPAPCDVAVIEGVMGLFDGRLGTDSFASTAHVARLTDSPVLLCVDVRHQSATVGAVVHGLATYDDRLRIGGVILNQVGSSRHEAEARRAIARTGIPVVGALPRNAAVEAPSRHLGLVPAAERPESRHALDALADLIAEHVDLDAVLALAAAAPPIDAVPWDPAAALASASGAVSFAGARLDERPVVAVAGGRAFTFRYAETEELLRAAGCDVVVFDPMTERDLPPGTAGLYLGGGFPEVHAAELSANTALRERIRTLVTGGLPTVAECAGLLYLCQTVDDAPMVGALPLTAEMTPRLAMGYREATAPAATLLTRPGETVHGHEFHRTRTTPDVAEQAEAGESGGGSAATRGDQEPRNRTTSAAAASGYPSAATPPVSHAAVVVEGAGTSGDPAPAWRLDAGPDGLSIDPAGTGAPTLHAAYLHVHWAGHPEAAARFAAAVGRYADGAPDRPGSVDRGSTNLGPNDLGSERTRGDGPGHRAASEGRHIVVAEVRAGADDVPPPVKPQTPAPGRNAQAPPDLAHHGDKDIAPGLVDLAVNVRPAHTPALLIDAVTAGADWSAYPDAEPLRRALAEHHGVPVDHVLPTAGGAEAFTLVARALQPAHPLVVHPQFTEPEAALRAAGHDVHRHLLDAATGFTLDVAALDRDHPAADLVIVGNPTNPTSVLHRRVDLVRLLRRGRTLLVDEAFMDLIPGEPESLIDPWVADPAGLLVVRSMTKTWGIAGLRLGYVVGDPALVARLAAQQPPWSVSSPAIAAGLAALRPAAQDWARREGARIAPDRDDLVRVLGELGLPVVAGPRAPFVLVDTSPLGPGSVREALAERGFAVRRGESFPGLGPTWIRLAVRDPETHAALGAALADLRRGAPVLADPSDRVTPIDPATKDVR